MDMVDQILVQINEETRFDAEKKNRKREETKAIICQYQNEREEYKRISTQQEMEQEESINAYSKMIQGREEDRKRKEEEEEEKKKQLWKAVAEETKNCNQSRDDYNDLRDLLWDQERQEREKQEEEALFRKKLQQKEELLCQNQEQIEAKKILTLNMEAKEEEIVKKMLEKFAADECNEMQKQLDAIRAKELYVEKAKRQRQEKEHILREERKKESEESSKASELETYKQAVIAQAHRRLLETHASQLQGFLD